MQLCLSLYFSFHTNKIQLYVKCHFGVSVARRWFVYERQHVKVTFIWIASEQPKQENLEKSFFPLDGNTNQVSCRFSMSFEVLRMSYDWKQKFYVDCLVCSRIFAHVFMSNSYLWVPVCFFVIDVKPVQITNFNCLLNQHISQLLTFRLLLRHFQETTSITFYNLYYVRKLV